MKNLQTWQESFVVVFNDTHLFLGEWVVKTQYNCPGKSVLKPLFFVHRMHGNWDEGDLQWSTGWALGWRQQTVTDDLPVARIDAEPNRAREKAPSPLFSQSYSSTWNETSVGRIPRIGDRNDCHKSWKVSPFFRSNQRTSSPADKISGRFWRRIKNPETSGTIKWLK